MKIGTMERGQFSFPFFCANRDGSIWHSFSKILQKCNFITEILRVCYNCVNNIDIL